MRISYSNLTDTIGRIFEVSGRQIKIGRSKENDLELNHPMVAPEALVIHYTAGAWELVALGGVNRVRVNGRPLKAGERVKLYNGAEIQLWPFHLTIELNEDTEDPVHLQYERQMNELIRAIHLALLERMDVELRVSDNRQNSDQYVLTLERNIDELIGEQQLFEPGQRGLRQYISGSTLFRETVETLVHQAGSNSVWQVSAPWTRLFTAVPEREVELRQYVKTIIRLCELHQVAELSAQIRTLEERFWNRWGKEQLVPHESFEEYLIRRHFKKEIKDIVFGYGPLESLLRLPTISEIMVVDRDRIFIEKNGVLEKSGRRFLTDEMTVAIIERIVAKVGRRIDKSSPLVDARLTDGSRVNAVIPPLAVSGPCLTVRKFPARKMTVEDLVKRGSLTQSAIRFLRAAVLARKNILIAGGTGSGKTTLLNCLSDFIPDRERIVTIEDTAELQLHKTHVVRLETRPANVEGQGAYTIRDLVKNSLRMRPDRIIVGECRGPEALDMLQAMNSGHDGSMTTLHANSATDVVLRLEVLVQMAADLPVDSIHRQIASAVDLVVQLHRLRDGRRCVTQITEFIGIDREKGGVKSKDLFLMEESDSAMLQPTGHLPTFIAELIERDWLDLNTFYQDALPQEKI